MTGLDVKLLFEVEILLKYFFYDCFYDKVHNFIVFRHLLLVLFILRCSLCWSDNEQDLLYLRGKGKIERDLDTNFIIKKWSINWFLR